MMLRMQHRKVLVVGPQIAMALGRWGMNQRQPGGIGYWRYSKRKRVRPGPNLILGGVNLIIFMAFRPSGLDAGWIFWDGPEHNETEVRLRAEKVSIDLSWLKRGDAKLLVG